MTSLRKWTLLTITITIILRDRFQPEVFETYYCCLYHPSMT